VSLQSLGLHLQLGHVSMRCSNPVVGAVGFQVLHTNGIHDVSIDYCGCERVQAKYLQLLRCRFYPVTQLLIKTCTSFCLLSALHLLALTSKASAFHFYWMLEKMTDNTGVQMLKSRYRALLRMTLQWQHLKMLKRAGCGHDPSGIAGTQPGDLAIPCPSCPHPRINIPDWWKDAPENLRCVFCQSFRSFHSSRARYLYIRILCMDANFCLKNQLVSNFSMDPGLSIGLAYFVARGPYESYVLSQTDADEVTPPTCTLVFTNI
jgi:hypothetical protein